MNLTISCVFYLLIGGGVGTALFLDPKRLGLGERVFRSVSGIVFWPLYLPMLLQTAEAKDSLPHDDPPQAVPDDDLAIAIAQVERELEAALDSLDGWEELALSDASGRIEELRAAWNHQAERIRELDQLLGRPEFVPEAKAADVLPTSQGNPTSPRYAESDTTRRENIARLHQIRRQMHDDLMGTLAWVRELVTMIHLAKFTGAPASRAQELIAQIAAAVEGLTEVSQWNQEAAASNS